MSPTAHRKPNASPAVSRCLEVVGCLEAVDLPFVLPDLRPFSILVRGLASARPIAHVRHPTVRFRAQEMEFGLRRSARCRGNCPLASIPCSLLHLAQQTSR